jgi:MmyB-like transcription regulator ligand binding domain
MTPRNAAPTHARKDPLRRVLAVPSTADWAVLALQAWTTAKTCTTSSPADVPASPRPRLACRCSTTNAGWPACAAKRSHRWPGSASTTMPASSAATCVASPSRCSRRWCARCDSTRPERAYLFDLAHTANAMTAARSRPAKTARRPRDPVRQSVRSILAGMTGTPAYVRNARMDILAANDLCTVLYDGILDPQALPVNLARFVFLDDRSRDFFGEWDTIADDVVGALRTEVGRSPADRALSDLVGELTTRSDAFSTRWARHNVRLHNTARKTLHSSLVGDIELNRRRFAAGGRAHRHRLQRRARQPGRGEAVLPRQLGRAVPAR